MILFLLNLIIIIIIHETAHLIAAKKVGCGIEIYSIGFGAPIFKKKIGKTIYQITPILIGGYCKMEGETKYSKSPSAFCNLRYRDKVAMIFAGCYANIISGSIAILLTMIGIKNYALFYFGYMSILLGITNLIPFPALDGAYPYLVWLEKIYGKKQGYKIINILTKIGFTILIILNILFLPYLLYLINKGGI